MGQLNKTIVECQKCGAVSKIETHKIRDVFDAVCPKCGSKHLYLRDVHLNNADDNVEKIRDGGEIHQSHKERRIKEIHERQLDINIRKRVKELMEEYSERKHTI